MFDFLGNGTLIFWSAITVICVVPAISAYWYRIRKAEIEADLKRAMIERGMSADEIERVLKASRDAEGR